MIIQAVKKLMPYLLIGLAITMGVILIFGKDSSYLETYKVNSQITIYQLNYNDYFSNLTLKFQSIGQIANKFIDFGNIQETLANSGNAQGLDVLKILANILILFLNLILIPFNFVGWIFNLIGALIGLKESESTNWIYVIFNIFRNMNIAYLT